MRERLSVAECHAAVREALDSLPDWVTNELGEVAVVVEDSHPEGLMGIYDPVEGVQRVVIFRDANETTEDVRVTVLHEIGHYFGMDEEKLEDLGYG